MKREIKFRGKRIDTNEWVYGYYFKTPLTDENSGTQPEAGWFFLTGEIRHCISNEHGVAFVVNPETIGEFIGLFDKDKKEIYEGDIVKDKKPFDGLFCEVFYITPCYWLMNLPNDGKGKPAWNLQDYEVVGNIFENKELLKIKL